MWIAILLTALSLAGVSAVYVVRCFGRFDVIKRISGGRRPLRIMLGLVPVIGFVAYALFDVVNSVIILIHLAVFFLIANGIARLIKCFCPARSVDDTANVNDSTKVEQKPLRPYYAGIAAILLCVVYLCIGWHLAHHVYRTSYTLETEIL